MSKSETQKRFIVVQIGYQGVKLLEVTQANIEFLTKLAETPTYRTSYGQAKYTELLDEEPIDFSIELVETDENKKFEAQIEELKRSKDYYIEQSVKEREKMRELEAKLAETNGMLAEARGSSACRAPSVDSPTIEDTKDDVTS